MSLNWIPYSIHPDRLTTEVVFRVSRLDIMAGPFAGMHYVKESVGGVLPAKLLGSYEKELIPILEKIRLLNPEVVLNIGAGEGYYAVGLLFSNFCRRVVAYEKEEAGRALMRQLLHLNSIEESRLSIKGTCTPEVLALELSARQNPVIIMDVEGDESVLLDPAKIPALRDAFVLVEIHEHLQTGLSDEIVQRVDRSHAVERIEEVERKISDLPAGRRLLSYLPKRYKLYALSEFRAAKMHWLWLAPRSKKI